ncbi:MAG: hypothetical protein AMXMBFR59_30900 [Rhodanobacteraceae bacterium]
MTMHFREIENEVLEILRRHDGRFLTAYQICKELDSRHVTAWKRIEAEYSDPEQATKMGQGTGHPYSPASFVANALKFLSDQDGSSIVQKELVCGDLEIDGVLPSPSADFLGIWAARI